MHHHKALIPSILTYFYEPPIQSAISLYYSSISTSLWLATFDSPTVQSHTSILPAIPVPHFSSIIKISRYTLSHLTPSACCHSILLLLSYTYSTPTSYTPFQSHTPSHTPNKSPLNPEVLFPPTYWALSILLPVCVCVGTLLMLSRKA